MQFHYSFELETVLNEELLRTVYSGPHSCAVYRNSLRVADMNSGVGCRGARPSGPPPGADRVGDDRILSECHADPLLGI